MSFASPFPDVDIPSASVYDYLFGNLDAADGARVALVDAKQGTETSYRDAVGKIDSFAGALADRGVGVGDVVGLLAPNSTAFAIAFHGILRAGATATTINVLFTAKDIVKQLTDSKATMLITVSHCCRQPRRRPRQWAFPTTDWSCSTARTATRAPRTCSAPFSRRRKSASTRPPTSPCCPTARARPATPRVSC